MGKENKVMEGTRKGKCKACARRWELLDPFCFIPKRCMCYLAFFLLFSFFFFFFFSCSLLFCFSFSCFLNQEMRV
ncbi:hypothetical protein COCSADRAFT_315189 [Bipolaris sorokiniana ND90Pr]|uniref:Uncharacterized protein n=1 Tax=Cochliobolus sativus (strain ND90Pr / ATCC 201652) TaxID=665912 RepID=M2SBZ9_COCSN|nr:uncharacterized protein COCSADRAFT_315189 [Bipolaris sorokiniana ND90Pr]EMD64833.1 hypothetical protein COCSADRAFT_315189 [Bipolaris sorokiniana ND90Pr]